MEQQERIKKKILEQSGVDLRNSLSQFQSLIFFFHSASLQFCVHENHAEINLLYVHMYFICNAMWYLYIYRLCKLGQE